MQNTKSAYLDEYRIIKTLGTGYSAKVKLAETQTHKLVAIKRFKPECANLKTLRHELSILRKLRHENLVNLIDVRENATYRKKSGVTFPCFAIVLQYVGGGELFDFIALGGRFAPNVARTYFQQMMNGLHYMHQQGFAHRDIKPENILLTNEFVLKIADFGFTGAIEGKDRSGYMRTKLGTQGYMAPEIPSKHYIGSKVDIFSAGVILFIMYTGTPPFQKTTPTDSYYKLIKQKNFNTFWSAHAKRKPPGFYTEDFKDLFNRMVAYDPEQRIPMEELAMHPWARGPVLTALDIYQDFTARRAKIQKEKEKVQAEKERKKAQREAAINNADLNVRSEDDEDPTIRLFLEILKEERVKDRKLKLQREVGKTDFVVDDTIENFFTNMFTYLSEPIKVDIDDEPIEFNAKYQGTSDDTVDVTYQYDTEGLTESVSLELKVRKTEKEHPVLTIHRLNGNPVYAKYLENHLKDQFEQLSV